MFALQLQEPSNFVSESAELEVHFTIPSVRKRGPRPRIPVIVRDAAPNGLVVLVSKEDGWLYKPDLDINREMSRNTLVRLRFSHSERTFRLTGRIVWSEGGQAGVRLALDEGTPAARQAFEEWVARLADVRSA